MDPSPVFFVPADLPPQLDRVEQHLPFPLALTYARVRSTFARQQPIEALWAVRDAWEAAIKFCACVSVADFLQAGPERSTAEGVASTLLSDRGVAIGGWAAALIVTLPEPPATARILPALRGVFRTQPGSKTTPHFLAVEQFPGWRNEVFGHGVFTHNLLWYAGEAVKWLTKLLAFYTALRPVFDGWALVARTADGQTVDWSGCEFEPKRERHRHAKLGDALPMFLAREGVELGFGPLLSVQRCKGCDHPAAFFFDRQKKADETVLLEYFAGAKGTKKNWAEVDTLRRWVPAAFKWERRVYDSGEVVEGVPILFRDFDREYLRPAYLLDAIRGRLAAADRGYVLLDGPEGTGKSYLARGLAEKETDAGLPVLAYYVRPGDPADYQFFASDLNAQVKVKLGRTTLDLQLKATTAAELQAEFADYFAKLLAGRAGAILVIDALDELPDADPATPLITDLLPDPAKLPANLHVVLTARAAELRPRVAARWKALTDAGALPLALDPASPDNRSLVGRYLELQQVAAVSDILARSGGVFLYAWHFVAALRQGVFAGPDELPAVEQFYPVFLDRIRRRVGDTLFETVYQKLLILLVAARVPVTREQIERWGLPADRLAAALNDLRDFVRQIRHRSWHEGMGEDDEPRYKIAHEAFVRFVEVHEAERLKDAHRTIATVALRHNDTQWKDLDPADDADLYDVRFVLWHCDAGGLIEEAEQLRADDVLARRAWGTADLLETLARHEIAVELYGRCESLYRRLIDSGRTEVANDLASALMNKGVALSSLGRLGEAVVCHDEAIGVRRDLVESGQSEVEGELAKAYVNKGNTLVWMGRPTEAVGCHDQAILILRRLVASGHTHLSGDLAKTLLNKGVALRNLGRFEEALGHYDEALALRSQLVSSGQPGQTREVVIILVNKGVALRELGRPAESLGCHDGAIRGLRLLIESGQRELNAELANALTSQGNTLQELGRPGEAVVSGDEAVTLLRQLIASGREELTSDLGRVVMNTGNGLLQMGNLAQAAERLDDAIDIYRRLITDGRTELVNDLASALVNRGAALRQLNRWGESVVCLDEAILIRRRLVAHGRTELANDLAKALVNKGNALIQLARLEEAVSAYDEAIGERRNLVASGRAELVNDLANALVNKGTALVMMARLSEGVQCYDEAISTYRQSIGDGRTELANDLARVLMNKGNALDRADELVNAANCTDEANGIFVHLFQMAQPQILPNLLQGLETRFELAVKQSDWPKAATVVGVGLSAFVTKQKATTITQPDQVRLNSLLGSVARLSADQRERLLSAADADLTEFLRTDLFAHVPPT